MPSVRVVPADNMLFHATCRDFEMDVDVPESMGGGDRAPLPSEVLMWAMGSCAATFVTRYFNNIGMDSSGIEIEVECERVGMKLQNFRVHVSITDPEKKGHEENIQKLVRNGVISKSMRNFEGSEVDVIYPDG